MVPDAPNTPCPGGTRKLVVNDANAWKTSYTHNPNRILRATADSLILENHRIMTINPLDPMNDKDPVTIGTKTSALISVEEYIAVHGNLIRSEFGGVSLFLGGGFTTVRLLYWYQIVWRRCSLL